MSETEGDEVAALRFAALDQALADLVGMRGAEGAALAADLRSRVGLIEAHLEEVAELVLNTREHIHSRLREKVAALLEPDAAGGPAFRSRRESRVAEPMAAAAGATWARARAARRAASSGASRASRRLR